MGSIGDRIRDERKNAGLSQQELGTIGGVSSKTQGFYERGERSADTKYLSKVSGLVDVAYIITGKRSGSHVAEEPATYEVNQAIEIGLDKALLKRTLNLTDKLVARFNVPDSFRNDWVPTIYAGLLTNMKGFTDDEVIEEYLKFLPERENP
jgi:transcriptional regulator with XRE-family HTH domain